MTHLLTLKGKAYNEIVRYDPLSEEETDADSCQTA